MPKKSINEPAAAFGSTFKSSQYFKHAKQFTERHWTGRIDLWIKDADSSVGVLVVEAGANSPPHTSPTSATSTATRCSWSPMRRAASAIAQADPGASALARSSGRDILI